MTLLLLSQQTEPPKTRNRRGCSNIFLKNVPKGERLTLAQAIEVLRRHW